MTRTNYLAAEMKSRGRWIVIGLWKTRRSLKNQSVTK
ncbi:hypothetical protein X946_3313 [Burkholderia sp. ABCPW 111]|nr:hypothetical protein X946_3313 [Burkholderia sp. ABCPW 111]